MSNMNDPVERLEKADIEMIKGAADALREPQAVFAFVQRHISRKYGLTASDKVDIATGAIQRPPAETRANEQS